jgi:Golgi phosphoprotein 3 (GPP34)
VSSTTSPNSTTVAAFGVVPLPSISGTTPEGREPDMERPRLAADFFLIVHDEFSGKPCVNAVLLACGLAGAQLAELVMEGRVIVDSGRLLAADARRDDTDEVAAYVAETVRQQSSTHTVRGWVDTFSEMLPELIARQLVADGVVRREQGGRQLMRRRPDRYPAKDLLAAARPRLRLEHMLRTPQEFDLSGAVLAVLVGALGIETILDPDLDRPTARELIGRLRGHLPNDLRDLIEGVEAAAAAISLTIRR